MLKANNARQRLLTDGRPGAAKMLGLSGVTFRRVLHGLVAVVLAAVMILLSTPASPIGHYQLFEVLFAIGLPILAIGSVVTEALKAK